MTVAPPARRRVARGLLVALGVGVSALFVLFGATRAPTVAYCLVVREGLPAPADDGATERVAKTLKEGGFEPRAVSLMPADSAAIPRDPAGQREVLQRVLGDAQGILAFWVERGEDGSLLMRSALLNRTDFEVAPGIRGTFTGDLERVVDVGSRDERAAAVERLSLRAVVRLKSAGGASPPSAGPPATVVPRQVSLPSNLSLAVLSFSRDWLVAEQDVQAMYGDVPLRFRYQDRVYDLLNDLRQAGPPWDGVKNYRLNRNEQVTYARMFAPVLVIGSQANPRAREEQLKTLCNKTNADGLVFGHLQMEPGKPLSLYVQLFLAANERWYTHRSEWSKRWKNEDVMSALRTSLEAVGRQAAEDLVKVSDSALPARPSPSLSEPPKLATLPSKGTAASSSIIYRVRKGDGLFSLARNCYGAHGASLTRTAREIETFNRLPGESLEIGQSIQLPLLIESLRLRSECGG